MFTGADRPEITVTRSLSDGSHVGPRLRFSKLRVAEFARMRAVTGFDPPCETPRISAKSVTSARFFMGWICLVVIMAVPGRAAANDTRSAAAPTSQELRVTFSPAFGRAQANATCEILDRELVRAGGGDRVPGVLAVGIACSLAAIVFLALLVLLTMFCRWFADARRIPKYDARRGTDVCARVRPSWWLGRGVIAALSLGAAGAVEWQAAGTWNRSGPRVAPTPRTIVVGPWEEAGSQGESSLVYAGGEPGAAELARRVVNLLEPYGLRPIRLQPADAGLARQGSATSTLALHLHSMVEIDMHVRRHPRARADDVLKLLCGKVPGLTLSSQQEDAGVNACEVRHARASPLSRIAAEQACAVLKENGFRAQVVPDPESHQLTRLSLDLPAVLPPTGTRLVLNRLPAQDVARLREQLEQAGFQVDDRPAEKPTVRPAILYYPSREAGDAVAARQRSGEVLQLARTQGFLGGDKQTWGVPVGRVAEQGYELSLVPPGPPVQARIDCDREFYRRLRPAVVQAFGAGNYALDVSCTAIDGNPPARPGVIRFPRVSDRIPAERLQAVLNEIVGLVDLEIAPAEEPQLDQIAVWLTYETNGAFHQFVGRFLETLQSSDRGGLAGFFSATCWQQDPVAQAENAASCRKIVPLRALSQEDDWRERFVRPWTFRLETIRLQKDFEAGGLHSIIRAERLVVCGKTAAGIRVETVPEEYTADFVVHDKFDVALTGGGQQLRAALAAFGSDLRELPAPAGAQSQTIYYQQDAPEAEAIARMTQAILEDQGLIFAIEARPLSPGDKVHVVAPAAKENRDE